MWPTPPSVVITPVMAPRSQGWPRPVSEPSSDSASAKPMEMPAPTEAAMPTRNVSQVLWVANAAANSGASVDTEPSIRPASPGCTTCKHEDSPPRLLLGLPRVPVKVHLTEAVREVGMLPLGSGEVAQQLADAGVGRLRQRALVEPPRLLLHGLCLRRAPCRAPADAPSRSARA